MTDTINTGEVPASGLEVSFGWTPAGTQTYTAPSGLLIAAPNAAHNVALTFTATAVIDLQGNDLSGPVQVIEYRWDFGDGVIGYGNPVTHTYKIANFQARTVLRVTDSKGRQWFVRAQMYLS